MYERNLPLPANRHLFELREGFIPDRMGSGGVGGASAGLKPLPPGVEALRAVESP
jgi:hypothetical protein